MARACVGFGHELSQGGRQDTTTRTRKQNAALISYAHAVRAAPGAGGHQDQRMAEQLD